MISCQRDQFSIPADVHYLNCAYMSPLAKRVEEAGLDGLRSKRNPAGIVPEDFFRTSDEVRTAFARLVNAQNPNHISLAPAASYGIASAAKNLHVPSGSEVLVLEEQFPSHIYSWRRYARDHDVHLNVIAAPWSEARGKDWNRLILESISNNTAAVCLPTVHWTDGTRFELEEIGKRARDVGAALIVDGTQSVGAVPFDVNRVQPDCLVCASYKWLLGPYSMAMVYWGERFLNGVPLEENWITRKGSENFAGLVDYRDEYHDGAIRYDVGERSNFFLMPMVLEGLTYLLELDPANIEEYCRTLTASALEEAVEMGYDIESSEYRSPHLFGIRVPEGVSFESLKSALADQNVSASVRGSAIRVSPNMYNNEADIDALLAALRSCTQGVER